VDITKEENAMKYNSIIFDLDGTLLDTLEDLTASVNYVMEALGYEKHNNQQIKSFVGNGIRNLILRALPDGVDDARYEEAYQLFCKHYAKHCMDQTRPYEGILELLSVLRQKNYHMAIVSNKNQNAVADLAREYFEKTIDQAIGQQEHTNKKPAPDTLYEAMKLLKTTKKETLYIGDSEVDKMTAENAGVDCILVSWGFREKKLLEEMKPLGVIDSPKELLGYL
jgi:phosphoglycolate phosphatase